MTETSKTLAVKRLDGPDDLDSSERLNPSWNDIETAIRGLDGQTRTMVVLGIGNPVPHMGIGGGTNGQYILYETPDNLTFHNLINPNADQSKVRLIAGGQESEYRAKLCVGLAEVLRAAKSYAESGQLDPTLNWEHV
jgi:immunity protein Imm1 of predicted polymorphic toxin system